MYLDPVSFKNESCILDSGHVASNEKIPEILDFLINHAGMISLGKLTKTILLLVVFLSFISIHPLNKILLSNS